MAALVLVACALPALRERREEAEEPDKWKATVVQVKETEGGIAPGAVAVVDAKCPNGFDVMGGSYVIGGTSVLATPPARLLSPNRNLYRAIVSNPATNAFAGIPPADAEVTVVAQCAASGTPVVVDGGVRQAEGPRHRRPLRPEGRRQRPAEHRVRPRHTHRRHRERRRAQARHELREGRLVGLRRRLHDGRLALGARVDRRRAVEDERLLGHDRDPAVNRRSACSGRLPRSRSACSARAIAARSCSTTARCRRARRGQAEEEAEEAARHGQDRAEEGRRR